MGFSTLWYLYLILFYFIFMILSLLKKTFRLYDKKGYVIVSFLSHSQIPNKAKTFFLVQPQPRSEEVNLTKTYGETFCNSEPVNCENLNSSPPFFLSERSLF